VELNAKPLDINVVPTQRMTLTIYVKMIRIAVHTANMDFVVKLQG
jgi:hypothetical protein